MASELSSPPPGTAGGKVIYGETTQVYNQWAEVYDTDGNALQAMDDLEFDALVQGVLPPPHGTFAPVDGRGFKIIDLGCGTGRNTAKLIGKGELAGKQPLSIYGLDASAGMLQVAEEKCQRASRDVQARGDVLPAVVAFSAFDMLDPNPQGTLDPSVRSSVRDADVVISTLVVEHIPLDAFFRAASGLLKEGGRLLLTNMHGDMGKISRAGFVDPRTGDKIRPRSFAHEIPEVLEAASRAGLLLAGEVQERAVTEDLVQVLGPRSKKWLGVKTWFGMIFEKPLYVM